MSLLMDALKRAETSKQEAARATPGKSPTITTGALSLEQPAPPTPGSTGPLPDLAMHIDAVDAELARTAHPESPAKLRPSPQTRAAQEQDEREAVRNAFAAKPADSPCPKGPLWFAFGTLVIAVIAISTYVVYQLNALGGKSTLRPLTPPPISRAPEIPSTPPSTAAESTPTVTPSIFTPQPRATHQPRTPTNRETEHPQPAIHFARSHPEPDANLLNGHAQLQRNDLGSARRNFGQALQRDPNNIDALLALAAIAQFQGRSVEADALRQRALVANPADSSVQAANLNSAPASTDPQATESRLKTLLSAQPESAPLNFALGNLYARQQRWPEAQQVYFNAVAADGDNPDYLFNLAVSLDHIRQSRPAAQYYRLALDAATRRPAAFDRDQVRRRLAELQPEPQAAL